jgi:anti-sigma B factor antagonist
MTMQGGGRLVERGPLTLRISDDAASGLRIAARGELDMSNAQALDVELERAIDTSAERIIVDLSGLKFIDSIGMATLGRIETHYGTERFGLIRAPQQVHRAIALTGLGWVLPFLTDQSDVASPAQNGRFCRFGTAARGDQRHKLPDFARPPAFKRQVQKPMPTEEVT